MTYTCPYCNKLSHNPNDEINRYCGACHRYGKRRRCVLCKATISVGYTIKDSETGRTRRFCSYQHMQMFMDKAPVLSIEYACNVPDCDAEPVMTLQYDGDEYHYCSLRHLLDSILEQCFQESPLDTVAADEVESRKGGT